MKHIKLFSATLILLTPPVIALVAPGPWLHNSTMGAALVLSLLAFKEEFSL